MAFPFLGRKSTDLKELSDIDYLRIISKGRTSGSIARKLGMSREVVEEALERLQAAGYVGFYSDSSMWFLTSNGQRQLESAA